MFYYLRHAVAVNVKSDLGHGGFLFWFVIFFSQFLSLKIDNTGRAFYTPGKFSPYPKSGHTACVDQYPSVLTPLIRAVFRWLLSFVRDC